MATWRVALCSSSGHTSDSGRCPQSKENTDYSPRANGCCGYAGYLRASAQRRRCNILHWQSECLLCLKGCSRSWDIQLLSTCWQLLCLQLGCRVWIEWVPSESNPADVFSREGTTDEATKHGNVETLKLPHGQTSKQTKISKRYVTPFATTGCLFVLSDS